MISIPVAVNNNQFEWQARLWWWNHVLTYGQDSVNKGLLIVIDKNFVHDSIYSNSWYQKIPHIQITGVWASPVKGLNQIGLSVPLNIQLGVKQVLNQFSEDQILEICDCDMFHFKKHPQIEVPENVLLVSDIYENWHLKSLSNNKNVIDIYFENQGQYYNGGFVPIIGRVKTFKKIIYEWEAIHRDILTKNFEDLIKWWAGMYALQAACEKARVTMINKDWCYVPNINNLNDSHYIAHYSVDPNFDKKRFPQINFNQFSKNIFYQRIQEWYQTEYLTNST